MAPRLTLALLVLAAAAPQLATARRELRQEAPAAEKYYEFRITTARQAPDCFEKNVILVNGQFQPSIEVKQGEVLVVSGRCSRRGGPGGGCRRQEGRCNAA